MKKIVHMLLTVILCINMLGITAFAGTADRIPSVLLPPEQKQSMIAIPNDVRGSLISTAALGIFNQGGGIIGVRAQTFTHVPVDSVRMRIYLDKFIEAEQRWAQQEMWEFEFTSDTYPDGELTMPSLSFGIKNYPSGNYYRLRGLHYVWKDGRQEGFSTATDGILITKYP